MRIVEKLSEVYRRTINLFIDRSQFLLQKRKKKIFQFIKVNVFKALLFKFSHFKVVLI